MDAAQNLDLLVRGDLAALDPLVQKPLGMRATPVRRVLRRVDQHDLDPGIGRDIGDARAHHAGADNAQLFHRHVRHGGAVGTLFQRFLVDEQAADHRQG